MLIVKAISLWAFACERQGRKQNNAEEETVEGERKKFLDFYCFAIRRLPVHALHVSKMKLQTKQREPHVIIRRWKRRNFTCTSTSTSDRWSHADVGKGNLITNAARVHGTSTCTAVYALHWFKCAMHMQKPYKIHGKIKRMHLTSTSNRNEKLDILTPMKIEVKPSWFSCAKFDWRQRRQHIEIRSLSSTLKSVKFIDEFSVELELEYFRARNLVANGVVHSVLRILGLSFKFDDLI